MARPLRITRPGAWHHVTARGIERRDIFTTDRDRKHWLAELIMRPSAPHIKTTARRAQQERKLMKLINTLSSNLQFET